MSRTPRDLAEKLSSLADYDLARILAPGEPNPFATEWITAWEESFHVELEFPGEFDGSHLPEDDKMELIREFCDLFEAKGRSPH